MWTLKHNLPTSCNRKCCNLGSISFMWQQKSLEHVEQLQEKTLYYQWNQVFMKWVATPSHPEPHADSDSGCVGRHSYSETQKHFWFLCHVCLAQEHLGSVTPSLTSSGGRLSRTRPTLWLFAVILWHSLEKDVGLSRPTRKLSQIHNRWRHARNFSCFLPSREGLKSRTSQAESCKWEHPAAEGVFTSVWPPQPPL